MTITNKEEWDAAVEDILCDFGIKMSRLDATHVTKGTVQKLVDEAQAAISAAVVDLIGEAEPFNFTDGNSIPMMAEEAFRNGRNEVKAELRAIVKGRQS